MAVTVLYCYAYRVSQMRLPYALVVTIEDTLGECDVYSQIQSLHRYQSMGTVRTQSKARAVAM